MVLTVVNYGTPILRQKGARVHQITPEIRKLAEDMLETMYADKGIGLAAQQVGVALQLAVIDVRGVTDRPSTLEIDGQGVAIENHMPLVLINPQWTPAAPPVAGPEGCLSFPEIYADIARPESVEVTALDLNGNPIAFKCGGLLARAVQHETDHLHGILFIDRMDKAIKDELRPDLDALQTATKVALKTAR